MTKLRVARLAADIRKSLGIEPVVVKGAVGQLDVFAGDELVASQSGVSNLMRRVTGPDHDELLTTLRARLGTT